MATAQDVPLRNPIDGEARGFLVFLPVYKSGLPHDSVVTAPEPLGVIAGVFQTATLFDAHP